MQRETFLRWYAKQIKEVTKAMIKEVIPELLRDTSFEVAVGVVLIIFPSLAIPTWVGQGFLPLESLWLLVATISGGFTLWAHGDYRRGKED